MNKTKGFLIGAGASYELGFPLVDELTVEFKKALLQVIDLPYYKTPIEIKNILLPLLNKNALNYEDIIGRIEVEIQRNENTKLHQDWNGVLQRYLEAIFCLLLERHNKNKIYIENRLKYLEPIKKYCDKSPLWIFSLNHDVLVEVLAKYLNIPIKYGFKGKVNIAGFNFEQLTRDDMENNRFDFIQNEGGINLVKIHGALDVFVQGDEKNYLKIDDVDSGVEDTANIINNLLENDASVKEGVKCTNQITYYDDNNVLQFLRMTIMSGKHKYSARVSHNMDDWFFKIFKGHINYVQELFCIGISFQDQHVNDVLYEWLSFSEHRKLVIVNPHIKKIPNTFSHLSEQVEIIDKGFIEFINKDNSKDKLKIQLNKKLRNISRKRLLKLG